MKSGLKSSGSGKRKAWGLIEPIRLGSLLLVSGVAVTSLLGCGQQNSVVPSASPTPTPTPTPTSTESAGILGVIVATENCDAAIGPPSGPDSPTSGFVKAKLPITKAIICQGMGPTGPKTAVVPTESLPRLESVLSQPDEVAAKPDTVCPLYADAPLGVVVKTADGKWLAAHIPQTTCGHYQRAAVSLLNEIIEGS